MSMIANVMIVKNSLELIIEQKNRLRPEINCYISSMGLPQATTNSEFTNSELARNGKQAYMPL